MPEYDWTCPACGHTNAAGNAPCDTCACPTAFTAADVQRCRDAFVATGGILGPRAAPALDETDSAIARRAQAEGLSVLTIVLGYLLGWLFS